MKRFLLSLTILLLAGSFAQTYSQSWLGKLGNKAAKQAENKAKKKVEDKVSKTVDKTVDDVFNKTEETIKGDDKKKNEEVEETETPKESADTAKIVKQQ